MRLRSVLAVCALSTCPLIVPAQTYTGKMDAGGTASSSLAIKHAGGTVVVGVALSDGLVLAADSRLTIAFAPGINPAYKVASDSASKVFAIGHVGIATFGSAFIADRSINSFVAEFEAAQKDQTSMDVEEVAKRFGVFFGQYYDDAAKVMGNTPEVGFLFAGYDKKAVGRLVEVTFPSQRQPSDLPNNTHDNQGAVWRGQTDVIRRVIKGADPRIASLPVLAAMSQDQQKQLGAQLAGIEYWIPFKYLMLQDGIDFALALVQITVDMQRFSFGTQAAVGDVPGVGGSVDVLSVTPTELTWIRKKSLTAK